jgi:hypothetical protein
MDDAGTVKFYQMIIVLDISLYEYIIVFIIYLIKKMFYFFNFVLPFSILMLILDVFFTIFYLP